MAGEALGRVAEHEAVGEEEGLGEGVVALWLEPHEAEGAHDHDDGQDREPEPESLEERAGEAPLAPEPAGKTAGKRPPGCNFIWSERSGQGDQGIGPRAGVNWRRAGGVVRGRGRCAPMGRWLKPDDDSREES